MRDGAPGDDPRQERQAPSSFVVWIWPRTAGKTADDFFHSQDLILVDQNKHIRGIYDGTEINEVDTLIDEIKLLLYDTKFEEK